MSNHQKCFFKNRAFRSAEVNLIYQMESRARGKERKQNVYSEWKEGNDISLARLLWWNAAGCMALTADICFSHFGWMGSRDQGTRRFGVCCSHFLGCVLTGLSSCLHRRELSGSSSGSKDPGPPLRPRDPTPMASSETHHLPKAKPHPAETRAPAYDVGVHKYSALNNGRRKCQWTN